MSYVLMHCYAIILAFWHRKEFLILICQTTGQLPFLSYSISNYLNIRGGGVSGSLYVLLCVYLSFSLHVTVSFSMHSEGVVE